METVYVFSSGVLRRKDNSLVLETDEGKKYIPVENISDIRIFGEITLNKRLLEFVTQKGIPLHFYNHDGYYVGTYYPRQTTQTGITFVKQVEHYLDSNKRVFLAKKFVFGAITNMIGVLRYYLFREVDLDKEIEKLKHLRDRLDKVDNIPEIMGIEGNARETYYPCFNKIIKDKDFHIQRRTKRPPDNYINTLISYGNSIVYTEVLTQIFRTHLDPRVGYLHESNQRRFSLNLDIAEVFKPVIVDRVIFRVVNKGQISKKHFSAIAGGLKLNERGKKVFTKELQSMLKNTVYHSKMKRNVSYSTLIRLEVYKIEKHILGMELYKPYFYKT